MDHSIECSCAFCSGKSNPVIEVCQCDKPLPGDSCAHTICKSCNKNLLRYSSGSLYSVANAFTNIDPPAYDKFCKICKDEKCFLKSWDKVCKCKCHNIYWLSDIKKLCMEYDKEEGWCVESYYEGMAVYQFILDKMGTTEEICREEWEKELNNV